MGFERRASHYIQANRKRRPFILCFKVAFRPKCLIGRHIQPKVPECRLCILTRGTDGSRHSSDALGALASGKVAPLKREKNPLLAGFCNSAPCLNSQLANSQAVSGKVSGEYR